MSNHHGYESYDQNLIPIANELALQREKYPMTILYLKLKYCGYAYRLFERMLQDKQFVGSTTDPAARLFAQFHAAANFRRRLEARGYPKEYIESSLSEVTFDSRQSALKSQKHKTAERILPFVTTYHGQRNYNGHHEQIKQNTGG